jgi:hypothetical protein
MATRCESEGCSKNNNGFSIIIIIIIIIINVRAKSYLNIIYVTRTTITLLNCKNLSFKFQEAMYLCLEYVLYKHVMTIMMMTMVMMRRRRKRRGTTGWVISTLRMRQLKEAVGITLNTFLRRIKIRNLIALSVKVW